MSKKEFLSTEQQLASEIKQLIEQRREQVAVAVNATMSMLYWNIGYKINEGILDSKRAEYGKQIDSTLSKQLIAEYGDSFSEKNLRRMMQFAEIFSDKSIVVSVIRQLTWTHLLAVIPMNDPLKRMFYIEMFKLEKCSVRTFRDC